MISLLTFAQGFYLNTDYFQPTKYFCTKYNKHETTDYYLEQKAKMQLPNIWKRISDVGDCNVECHPCETLSSDNLNVLFGFSASCNNINEYDIHKLDLHNYTEYHQPLIHSEYKFIPELIKSPLRKDGIYEAYPNNNNKYIHKYTICLKSEYNNKIKLISQSSNKKNIHGVNPVININHSDNEDIEDELDDTFDGLNITNSSNITSFGSKFNSTQNHTFTSNQTKLSKLMNLTQNQTFDDSDYDYDYDDNITYYNNSINNVNKSIGSFNNSFVDENYLNDTINLNKTYSLNSSNTSYPISSRIVRNPTFNQNASSVPKFNNDTNMNVSNTNKNSMKISSKVVGPINKVIMTTSSLNNKPTTMNNNQQVVNNSTNNSTTVFQEPTVYQTSDAILSDQTIKNLIITMLVVAILTLIGVLTLIVYKVCCKPKDLNINYEPVKNNPSDSYIY